LPEINIREYEQGGKRKLDKAIGCHPSDLL